jgi:hypothetical protein
LVRTPIGYTNWVSNSIDENITVSTTLEFAHFNLGLIIIGVGCNLGYVGASVLLTKSHRPEEKAKRRLHYWII